MSTRARNGLCEQLRLDVRIPQACCKTGRVLIALLLLPSLACSAQERTLSFINRDDSLKQWNCPLPVEVTIQTKDKRKIPCVIIEADGSGFFVLDLLSDTALQATSEWRRKYSEMQRGQGAIESDRSLSEEEKRKLILQKSIGVIYRDTIRIMMEEIKKVTLHYCSASRFQRTIPVVAYGVAGCVFMVGMVELMFTTEPEVEGNLEAPYPAVFLLTGVAGVTASGIWMFHTYHKVIRPSKWRLRGWR